MRAFDILNQRAIRALIFPVSSLIGKSNQWDKIFGAPSLPLLGRNELRFLVNCGWIVGSHTHTHADLTSLEDAAVIREIQVSISALDALDLLCAKALAYPYGTHDARVSALARLSGVKLAFTTKPGTIAGHTDPLAIPRVEIYRGDVGDCLLNKIRDARAQN
jgi:peptidoglycan/xylan/chitin deacetylase (PgdA/CDA1 family)